MKRIGQPSRIYAPGLSVPRHIALSRATSAHLPAHFDTFPALLREAGYYCTNNFKTHYNCDVDPAAICDESSPKAHWPVRPDDVAVPVDL